MGALRAMWMALFDVLWNRFERSATPRQDPETGLYLDGCVECGRPTIDDVDPYCREHGPSEEDEAAWAARVR